MQTAQILSSAASILVAAVAAVNQTQVTADEREALHKITSSVVVLMSNGSPTGSAACIDDRGYFLAHRVSVPTNKITGRLYTGQLVQLDLTLSDEPTQLVLLEAENWIPGMATPASVTDGDEVGGKTLIAILPAGAIRAKFSKGDRVGVLSGSKRLVPLSEVRFEDPGLPIAGALIFSYDGHLLGALNGTLAAQPTDQLFGKVKPLYSTSGKTVQPLGFASANSPVGPGVLTVGYTIGPDEIRRVVAGFRSPSRTVVRPTTGLYCKDVLFGSGVLVASVQEGSPAAEAQMRPGDVIKQINGKAIKKLVDFARAMIKEEVGDKVDIRYVRNGVEVEVEFVVGKQSS